MLVALGKWVVKYRLWVILTWGLLLIPGVFGAVHLHEVMVGEAHSPRGSETEKVEHLLADHFPGQTLHNIMAVFESESLSLENPAYQKIFEQYLTTLRAQPGVLSVLSYQQNPEMLSQDHQKTFIYVNLDAKTHESADTLALQIRAALGQIDHPPEIEVSLTGGPFFTRDVIDITSADGVRSEKRVLPLILIVLILAFGGLMAAFLPLITGMISTVLTLGILYGLAQFLEITSLSQNITTMIGLGVGIDYSLLMVNRFREELLIDNDLQAAAIRTVDSAGRTILYSALVVSIGMMALLIPRIVFMQSLGLSGVFVVLVTLALGLTLLPALLAQWGNYLDSPLWLSRWINRLWQGKRAWYHWAKLVMRRPVLFTCISLFLLVGVSAFSLKMERWNSSILLMPAEMEARQGLVTIMEIDPKLVFSPIIVTFATRDGSPIWTEDNMRQMQAYASQTVKQEPIESAVGMLNPLSTVPFEEQMALYRTLAGFGGLANLKIFQPSASLPFTSPDETRAMMLMFHKYGPEYEAGKADLETIKSMRSLRDRNQANYANLEVNIGGLSALPVALEASIYKSFPIVILVILSVTYLLTLFSFGSLWLPLKAVVLNLISVTATYGIMVLVFQYGFANQLLGIGPPPPGALLIVSPLILFCIIFGLSMDYEIFLINRIKEEYLHNPDLEEAIALGLEKTGGIITSAGIIMILVFLGFAFSRIILIKEFGLGLATAIFIDATIIRIMVVPAVMKLMGRWCWYLPKALQIPVLERLFRH